MHHVPTQISGTRILAVAPIQGERVSREGKGGGETLVSSDKIVGEGKKKSYLLLIVKNTIPTKKKKLYLFWN